jgi:hypothetical protein
MALQDDRRPVLEGRPMPTMHVESRAVPDATMIEHAHALLNGALCACGQPAVRVTIDWVPRWTRKQDRKRELPERRYGYMADLLAFDVVIKTWCGQTDEAHERDRESALNEDDL